MKLSLTIYIQNALIPCRSRREIHGHRKCKHIVLGAVWQGNVIMSTIYGPTQASVAVASSKAEKYFRKNMIFNCLPLSEMYHKLPKIWEPPEKKGSERQVLQQSLFSLSNHTQDLSRYQIFNNNIIFSTFKLKERFTCSFYSRKELLHKKGEFLEQRDFSKF